MRCLFPAAVESAAESLSTDQLWHHYPWADLPDRAWVRANMVTSIDGRLTGRGGHSREVSSPADRRVFAILRAGCDAVLVGASTALLESYQPITIPDRLAHLRLAEGRTKAPQLVVASRTCRLDPSSRLFAGGSTVVLTCGTADTTARHRLTAVAQVWECGEETVDLARGLALLSAAGRSRVLCEGGPRLLSSMLEHDLVDELCLTTTPLVVGPPSVGPPTATARLLTGPEWTRPSQPMRLALLLEEDGTLLCRWQVAGGDV